MEREYYQDIVENRELVEMIAAVPGGSVAFDKVLSLAAAREKRIGEMRKSFNAVIAAEPEQVRAFCKNSIADINRYFDAYLALISRLMQAGASFDTSVCRQISEEFRQVYENLTAAFIHFRDEAMIARGPTTHPGINTLINIIDRILHEEPADIELKETLGFEIVKTEKALEFLLAAEESFFTERLGVFYQDYIDMLYAFDQDFDSEYEPATDKEWEAYERDLAAMLEELKEGLLDLGEEFKTCDVNYIISLNAAEPTPLPQVNVLLNVGDGYLEGEYEREVFEYFLEEFQQLFSKIKFQFDGIMMREKPPESETVVEETEVTGEILDDIEDAVDGFYEFLETGDAAIYDESAELLTGAAADFAESVQRFEQMSEESEMAVCVKCGKQNPAGRTACFNCNTLLPQTGQAKQKLNIVVADEQKAEMIDSKSPGGIPAYVFELIEAGEGFNAGIIDIDQFRKVIADTEKRLKNAWKYAKEPKAITDAQAQEIGEEKAVKIKRDMVSAATLYREGLEKFAEGLDYFIQLSETPSDAILEQGRETILDAVGILTESRHIAEKEVKIA